MEVQLYICVVKVLEVSPLLEREFTKPRKPDKEFFLVLILRAFTHVRTHTHTHTHIHTHTRARACIQREKERDTEKRLETKRTMKPLKFLYSQCIKEKNDNSTKHLVLCVIKKTCIFCFIFTTYTSQFTFTWTEKNVTNLKLDIISNKQTKNFY